MLWVAIAIGGAVGSIARHAISVVLTRLNGQPVPYATAVVNIVGCFVIGLLAGLVATGSLRLTANSRAFLFVGILGGFTTFSSLGLDTFVLIEDGSRTMAIGNVLVQVGMGLPAVFAGYAVGSAFTRG